MILRWTVRSRVDYKKFVCSLRRSNDYLFARLGRPDIGNQDQIRSGSKYTNLLSLNKLRTEFTYWKKLLGSIVPPSSTAVFGVSRE